MKPISPPSFHRKACASFHREALASTAARTIFATALLLTSSFGCATTTSKPAGTSTADAAAAAETATIKPVIDQRATAALKEMSDTLAHAKSMSFDVSSMAPIRGPNGQWLHLLKTAHVEMQRPNKLRVDTGGDAFPQSITFDGKTYSSEAKDSKLYSQTEMPAETIDAVLSEAAKRGGNVFTFSDVLLSDPYSSWTQDLEGAVYVGESTRGEFKLQHFALRAKTVHWEVWIGEKDHLPHLVFARYVSEQHSPSILVEFSKWHLNGHLPPSRFAFKAPSGSKRAALKAPTLNDGAKTE